jgi:uncharacterized Tic20 family protein
MNDLLSANLPNESECEKSSNSYLMSVITVIIGLPLPLISLITTLSFYLANRKSTWFVRWHCTQAMLSQSYVVLINTCGFIWSMMIFFGSETITNNFIGFIITLIIFNVMELILTIYAAIETRKGKHIQFYFFGTLTDIICKT